METENHSRAQFQVVGTGKSKADEGLHSCTWVLRTRKQDEVMPEQRHRAAQAGSVPGTEKRISKAHRIPSDPAGETEHPDVKKTIYRSIS